MKFAVSNIALPAYNHRIELSQLASLGLSGLEVAPSRIWQETWLGLSASEVSGYRREVEQAGLSVVGLHSLLFDQRARAFPRHPDNQEDLRFLRIYQASAGILVAKP